MNRLARTLPAIALLVAAWLGAASPARAIDLAQTPLFLSPAINPNVLVLLDNSQSMDGTMGGKVISGANPETRSNVARSVLRDVVETYRHTFNWGLGSFGLSGVPARADIFGYYLGNEGTMRYTNTCTDIVDGVGVSDIVGLHAVVVEGVKTDVLGPLPCIANPQPDSTLPPESLSYITFDRSGDDADVNDVTYISALGAQMYGIGDRDTTYLVFGNRTFGIDWYTRNFGSSIGRLTFGATDSGWVADALIWPRRLWVARGWGYNNDITGKGVINEPVVSSQPATTADVVAEAAHFATLNALIGPEDDSPTSLNLKNAARYTPLAGTVETGRRYFSGEGHTSPIGATCQRNFVVLATDGNPTGKKDGSQYNPAEWVNTFDAGTGLWTYGPAIVDVLTEIAGLRTTPKDGQAYDVQTYVIGMGDTVGNPSSVAALHEMARQGGTKSAYLASSSEALTSAFAAIASDIDEKSRSGAAAGLSSGSWQTGVALYQGKFSSVDWSGDLLSIEVGSDGTLNPTPTWRAAERLNGQNWDTGRAIVTYRPASIGQVARGVPFRWPADPAAPTTAELHPSQILALNTDGTNGVDEQGELRLRYLRGNAAREARNCAACVPAFRSRPATVLGDIVGSAPFYVGAPWASYYDDFESAPYSSFATAWRGRTPYVYVGANDGMLHAFDAATGDEKFAYVPNLVFDSLSALSAIPFTHRFNVDGPPAVADVFYDGAWHTLLVAGLRAGGRGLYALDVTDPSQFTEAGAGSIVRWELSDPDLGHVFAPPTLARTNNGRWSVIVGNGYASPARDRAVLFVIDAESGAIVRKIDAGSATSNGLSAPAAVDVDGDGIVDVVYAGDLTGKLWKFDLSSASADDWALAVGGEALFDAGTGKAITSRPDVTRTPKGGYLVTFGTGRYLSPGDPASTAAQTAYGIWDKDGTVVTAAQLQEQLIEIATADAGGDTYRTSTHRVDPPTDFALANDLPTITRDTYYATKRGWFVPLPATGERIVVDARIRGGRVIFTSIIPDNSDICEPTGISWVLEFDVFTGNRLDRPTFDVNGDGSLTDADYLVFPGSAASGSTNTSGWKIDGFASGAAFMGFKDGNATSEIKYLPTSDGVVVQKREAASAGSDARVMWRVVQ